MRRRVDNIKIGVRETRFVCFGIEEPVVGRCKQVNDLWSAIKYSEFLDSLWNYWLEASRFLGYDAVSIGK